MSFLQRLGSGIRDAFSGGSTERRPSTAGQEKKENQSLKKLSSRARREPSSSLNFLEASTRDAISGFVRDKFEKGEAKPHVFTQFWLQFPKLEAGFEVLRRQLELRTGSREGPLPLALLQSAPRDFGLGDSSGFVKQLCTSAAFHKCCEVDFVGFVMVLLVVHLTEPATAASLHADVRTMLSCLELAFTHFTSAKRGKLDKREVGEALQYEAAKAHTKEGKGGRTSGRLANRLFEGLDWDYDNTISFEAFLRGIIKLVEDEFGEDEDGEDGGVASFGRVSEAGAAGAPQGSRASASRPGTATR